jgi:uncharacterized protein YxjI
MGSVIVSDRNASIQINIFKDEWKFVSNLTVNEVYIAKIIKRKYNGVDSYHLSKPWKKAGKDE